MTFEMWLENNQRPLWDTVLTTELMRMAWEAAIDNVSSLPHRAMFDAGVAQSKIRIIELETAIVKTLNENRHLADGEDCTLIDLKRAMPTWELE